MAERETGMPQPPERLARYVRVGWGLLLGLGLLPILAAGADLLADLRDGLPADHQAAFASVAGQAWPSAQQAAPAVTRYISLLEVGYALHELVFGLFFLVLVAIPLRRGARWAWWACWLVLIADVGYSLTFGRFDSVILRQSLVADIATPLLLLSQLPRLGLGPAAQSGVTSKGERQKR